MTAARGILIRRETFHEPSKPFIVKYGSNNIHMVCSGFGRLDGSPTRIPHPAVATHGRSRFGLFPNRLPHRCGRDSTTSRLTLFCWNAK